MNLNKYLDFNAYVLILNMLMKIKEELLSLFFIYNIKLLSTLKIFFYNSNNNIEIEKVI